MIYAGLDRDVYLEAHYTYDEEKPFKELIREFFFTNFAYNRCFSLAFNRETYISYIKVYRQEPLFGRFYNDSLRQLIERGIRENAFRQELTPLEYYHMLHDWIIGFFTGWSIHPERSANVDAMYDNIMNAMVDALIK